MLGHKMLQTLRLRYPEVLGAVFGTRDSSGLRKVDLLQGPGILEHVDASDRACLESILGSERPDVVVNCVGVIKQREDARRPVPAILLNTLLPHDLVRICSAWGGRVIHFSTDCVFDGKAGNYSEDDLPNAEDLYGRTKALGEIGLWGEPNALTLRTSIIGRELAHFQSLLEWFLSQRGKTVRGFTRAIYSGVTTNHLASIVSRIISDNPKLSGLYQVASAPISKHDLLCMIRDAFGLQLEIVPDDSTTVDRSMRADKLRQAIGYECLPWSSLVKELAEDATPYERWRS